MFDIKLLGSGQVYYKGKAITGFPGQQHCLLFYYLLLNRQIPHTREQVAAVFWGDLPSSLARKNLRNALWRLGEAFRLVGASLDELITVQDDCIAFGNPDSYRLDIDEFEAASRSNPDHSGQGLSLELVTRLESAVVLYRGDLLEGVYEDWCLFERERLRLAFVNILIRLMNHHAHTGSYERGLEYGQRILQLDPTRERVHRQMMMIHWLAGDREAALMQYRSCSEILRSELDLQPVQETRHLYEMILRSSSAPDRRALGDPSKLESSATGPSNPPLKEILQKLHLLESIVEQTNAELHLLKGLIHRSLEAE